MYVKYINIYKDIINVENNILLSNKKYHDVIAYFKKIFIPCKKIFLKKSVSYDIKAKPLDYVFNMIVLNRKLEMLNQNIIKNYTSKGNPPIYKLFNALPLRTDIVHKYTVVFMENWTF
jgi:hypothetical protein